MIGSLSITQWVFQHSANLATTGPQIGLTNDTAYHTVEMWGNGIDGALYGRVDGGTVLQVVPTVTYSKQRLLVTVRNGSTTADQRLQLGHIFFAVQP